ncbi:MAG: hypothetical protein NTY80_00265 [candidate division SR1 bacterium]|nr:hypothetical protein [candidate division SR1 bacterium]
MLKFFRDLIIYPFDSHKETNKFAGFLKMTFKEYPAFLWVKPSLKKVLVFPFIMLYCIFKGKAPIDKR